MTVEAPDHYGGKPIPEDAIEIALAAEKKEREHVEGTPLIVKANINLSDYVQIPGTDILIAKQETLEKENWENTHYKLAENELFMPSPAIFMPYFVKVRDAAQGSLTLYDGNNNPISKDEAEDLWKYLSTDHRGGCWTWLDAFFTNTRKGIIAYDNKVQRNPNGSKVLLYTFHNLESTIYGDCCVNIDFDKQGLPKSQSVHQEYKQGENIYYSSPKNTAVASFYADVAGAGLVCDGGPSNPYPKLGVFACVEKSGGKQ